MAATARPNDNEGCQYGRSNRWALGTVIVVLLTLGGLTLQAFSEQAQATRRNRDMIYEEKELVGRVDERLASMAASLSEIKAELEKQRRSFLREGQ